MNLNGDTRVFGIIGYPVRHSLSPAMQNAAFKKLGSNAVYAPFEVKPEELEGAVAGIRALGLGGVNITIPHKERVLKFLDELSPQAGLIGAVNTIVNRNGRLSGHNTDMPGFLKSLKEDLGFNPRGKTAFVVGSGGGAKAVGFGLALAGARRIILTDCLDERALELACEIELKTGCECIALQKNSKGIAEIILNSQLLVNATPCGMKAGDPPVISADLLHGGLSVFDLIYNRKTKLISAALGMGLKAVQGLNMLLYQGAISFELWTGKKAPIEVMRREVKT
ncbi:MAG: shikimate dehydrogenase [Candidatus Omnitrophica bacterium]|nr:shikimate dehydrogenase [Candidatus Omnitrophota bacterium]